MPGKKNFYLIIKNTINIRLISKKPKDVKK